MIKHLLRWSCMLGAMASLAGCGARAPLAQPAPTAVGLLATPAPATATPAPAVDYLLPPDFSSRYELVSADEGTADAAGFQLSIVPRGRGPGAGVTIEIVGGPAAAAVWAENQPGGQGALIEPVSVRGVPGTIASSGYGATISWQAAGVPYYAALYEGDQDAMIAFVDALAAYDRPVWEALTAAAPDRLPPLAFLLPADYPAAYPDHTYSADYPAEEGYRLTLYPQGIAAEPPSDVFIEISAGDQAAFLVEQAFAAPAPLFDVSPLTLRGVDARLALAPGGLFLAWVEGGAPYALSFKGVEEDRAIALAEGMRAVGQSSWLSLVGP